MEHSCAGHGVANLSVRQSLSEMEFERGIWSAGKAMYGIHTGIKKHYFLKIFWFWLLFTAMNGEEERVKSLVMKGTSPNATDNYGYTALVRNPNCVLIKQP